MPASLDPMWFDHDRYDLDQRSTEWLKGQRDALLAEAADLLKRQESITTAAAGRELTNSQKVDWRAIEDRARFIDDGLAIVEGYLRARQPDRQQQPNPHLAPIPDYRTPDPAHRGILLAPEQRTADFVRQRGLVEPNTEGLSLGKVMRGWVTGQWAGADAERRAMAEGTNSAGGYLVPTVLSATVIDIARNKARVMQAGARTVPMESEVQQVPRQITDPTVAWRLENAAINNSGPTFDLVQMNARSLACVTTIARELLEDTKINLEDFVEQAIGRAIALEIDRVALRGSGVAPEPRGLLNTTGVTVTSLGANGAALTYDNLGNAVQVVQAGNFDPNAVIYPPRTANALALTKDGQLRYLAPPTNVAPLALLPTQQIPTNLTQGTSNNAAEVYVGQWDQLWVGVRTQLVLTVLTERYADLGQVGIVAWWRGDIAVAHPTAFNIITGVTS